MKKLTEEQELMLENLREVMKRECPESYLNEVERKQEYPYKLAKVLYGNGFLTMGIPEEYGGTPADTFTLCLFYEELGKLGAPWSAVMSALTVGDVLLFGSEKQKWLSMEMLKKHEGLCYSLGITEPGAGSDDNAIATTYTRRNGKVYLNGHKCFITLAAEAPYMLCFAKNPEEPNPKKAITMWMVDMKAKGVTTAHMEKIGSRCAPLYEVYLEDVELEEEDIIGKEGEGFMNLMKNFEAERVLGAVGALGWAEAAYADACTYANQRVQFGKPIGSFQLIQKRVTEMAIRIENMRNLVYNTAEDIDAGRPAQISSALCKYYVAIASGEVIDSAMQVLGGIGYTCDHRVSRLWRDVRSLRIGGGTDEVMIHILGRAILKKYR